MPQTYTCVPNNVPPTQYVNNTSAGTPVLNYDIGFPYIQTTDIIVFTGDTGSWTQRNQGTGANEYQINPQGGLATDEVVFNNGVGGANILIWRRTDLCDMGRTFTAGSSIRAEDLNQDFTQLLYILQEAGALIDGIVDGGTPGGGLPLPGDQLDLDDLGDVEITSPANPSWLRWNGTNWEDQPILEDGDAWVADDNHVVTSARGDDRWLNSSGDIIGRDMITATESGGTISLDVDLAAVSGLESTNPGNAAGELRIDVNDGCEIVAAGLNAETTDASIVQTGGTNADPAIRVATTLGTVVTNNDLQITGGANVTVTRNSANQLTIAGAVPTGGATFRGTVDVDNDNTLPATTAQQNPNAVNVGDAFTVENNVAAADVTANWNTVLDNWDTGDGIINSGDVIICTTAAAAGSPTDARYNLIRTGGNINTLQQVTDAGNTTTNDIVLDDSTLQIQEGVDTLTVNWPTGTADRTISFPDASGTVALTGDVPAAANDGALTITAGTNLTAAITGGQFTANKATATGITLDVDDVFVLTAGDTMTGNLVMNTANITGDSNAITAGAGNWDLDNGNFWTLAGIVVPVPTNMAEGISGLIVNTAAATWPAAGGATFQYAANTPPNITEFPAVIPFYCISNTEIFIGTPTVNIV